MAASRRCRDRGPQRDTRVLHDQLRHGAGRGVTRVGSDNWIMAYVHIAHDCAIGDRTIMANNAQLAGHVPVGDDAILGGFTAVTSSAASARTR